MFNVQDLILENVQDTSTISSMASDESYTICAMREMSVLREEYLDANKILRLSILESNMDYVVINESFSTFFDKVKKIIGKIVDFIKSIFKRFITALHRIVLSDKYISKHADDLKRFDDEKDKFEYKGFAYTFNNGIPVIEPVGTFEKSFLGFDYDALGKDVKANKEVFRSASDNLKSDLDDESIYDKVRAQVLGKPDPSAIFKEDFADELYEQFRFQQSTPESMDITSSIINSEVLFFKGYEKQLNKTKREESDIEKKYKRLEDTVRRLASKGENNTMKLSTTGVDKEFAVDAELMTKVDTYLNTKCTEIIEIGSIHSMAFAAKLDALKEAYKQSKEIMYKALSKIEKREGIHNGK